MSEKHSISGAAPGRPPGKAPGKVLSWARKAFLPPAKSANMKYLARSIVLEEAGPPHVLSATITILCGLVLAFLAWSAIVELDETATATGEILPEHYVQPVQHLEGGIIARIVAHDGEKVKAGDAIVIMDDTAFLADLDRVRARYTALSYQVERLRAFALDRDMKDVDAGGEGDNHDALKNDQIAIYETQIKARDTQLAVLRDQIEDRRKEMDGLVKQEEMLNRQIALVQQELSVRKELLDKGLTSKLVYLNTEREMNRTKGELAQVESQQARSRVALSEARARYVELEARLRNEALAQMGEAASELAQVAEEKRRLEDKVQRLVVAAPVSGTIKGMTVKAEGAVLPPGGLVAEVVPDEDDLVAEVRISPRDIGYVKVGVPALVKVATYDFGRYGGIEGEVSYVSAASFLDEKGNPYFRGRVTLDKSYVGAESMGNIVTPGMTLIADIKTGEKSLLGYLIRPVQRALSTAFSER